MTSAPAAREQQEGDEVLMGLRETSVAELDESPALFRALIPSAVTKVPSDVSKQRMAQETSDFAERANAAAAADESAAQA